jgi:hypothetical protein
LQRQLNNNNNSTQHARFMRAFYCPKKDKGRKAQDENPLHPSPFTLHPSALALALALALAFSL